MAGIIVLFVYKKNKKKRERAPHKILYKVVWGKRESGWVETRRDLDPDRAIRVSE